VAHSTPLGSCPLVDLLLLVMDDGPMKTKMIGQRKWLRHFSDNLTIFYFRNKKKYFFQYFTITAGKIQRFN
jgi:hypothetical protein